MVSSGVLACLLTLSRQILGEIIEPRVDEIFTLVNHEIVRSGYEGLVASGILLTGGSALMEGIVEAAERIFNLPVRRGYPNGVGGLVDVVKNPQYATGVGLIQHAWTGSNGKQENGNGNGFFKGMARKTKQWFGEFF